MGIRHLQTFMETAVPNGYVQVTITDECRKYQIEHDWSKPILVFDLMGITSILNRSKIEMLYGGRHGEYSKVLDKFFKRLSSMAKLVFFEDGPVVQDKYDTWIRRQNDKFAQSLQVIDNITEGVPIRHIVEEETRRIPGQARRQIPTVATHLELIESKAKQYGELIVTVTKECDAELARYATNNPAVIAVLADDTNFLIFRGNWRYWSLAKLNVDLLTTMEFSRAALRSFLNLNDDQLSVLSTIAGNDLIDFKDIKQCHGRHFGYNLQKFPAMSEFIRKEANIKNFNGLVFKLSDFLFNDKSDKAQKRIVSSLNQYNIKFDPVDDLAEPTLLKFCRDNGLDFAYSILKRMPKNFTLVYWDLRRSDVPDIFEATKKLFQRQIGIILQHERQPDEIIQYEIYAKRILREGYQRHLVMPEYPPVKFYVSQDRLVDVPPLMNLLDSESLPEFNIARYALLTWSIGDRLFAVDLLGIPPKNVRNVLTLYYLVQEKFIEVWEADIILLTILAVEIDIVQEILRSSPVDPIIDERAFRISFLFSKFHQFIGRSMKSVGLDNLNSLLNFDGVLFHCAYARFKSALNDLRSTIDLLHDIKNCRIYSTFKLQAIGSESN